MSLELCGYYLNDKIQGVAPFWQQKGVCQTSSKPYCYEYNSNTNYCSTDNTKNANVSQYNYVAPPEFCGYNYSNSTNKGKCTTADKPCCSGQNSGTCGTMCIGNTANDYKGPASTASIVQPSCDVSTWSACNAPVCNGKQDKTSGTQTRNYTSTSNCISNQLLTQPCENTCPTPKRCGIGSSNNTTKCTQSNDCCSSDGYCGKGPNFCQSNSQYMYCADLNQNNYGYQDNNDKCQTKKALALAQAQAQAQASAQAPIQKPTQEQENLIKSEKQQSATTQCGKDRFGFTRNYANVEYGRCKNPGECCSGWLGTSFYGWCGPQGNSDYCYSLDQQVGYGQNN